MLFVDSYPITHKEDRIFIIMTGLIVVIFAGSVFLTSERFNNEQNSIKWFVWGIGSIVWLLLALLCVRDLKVLTLALFSRRLLKCLFVLGSFQALYVLFQSFDILPSNHDLLIVTGTFENPAGAVSVLALLFPAGLHLLCYSKSAERLGVVIQLLLYIAAIAVCQSRTGVLAAVLSASVYFLVGNRNLRLFVARPPVICCIAAIGLLGAFALFRWKSGSSNGRIFILTVSLGMIMRKPLFGYGPHGFTANYMVSQAAYFADNPDSVYAVLADNIIHPFNEYVNIAVNYGIAGLAAFIGIWALLAVNMVRRQDKGKSLWFAVLTSYAVLSAFSYPLHYAHVWFAMLALAVYSLRHLIPHGRYWAVRIPVMFLCLAVLFCFSLAARNELHWKMVQDKALEGYSFSMQKYYGKLHPDLKRNHLFLYNYAAEQNICSLYDESLRTVMESQKMLNDYDTQLLLADNYENIGDSAMTVAAYSLAHNMIPCRFVPLYCLMEFYWSRGDSLKACDFARQILEKPVKIPSEIVDMIKTKAEDYYLKHAAINYSDYCGTLITEQ